MQAIESPVPRSNHLLALPDEIIVYTLRLIDASSLCVVGSSCSHLAYLSSLKEIWIHELDRQLIPRFNLAASDFAEPKATFLARLRNAAAASIRMNLLAERLSSKCDQFTTLGVDLDGALDNLDRMEMELEDELLDLRREKVELQFAKNQEKRQAQFNAGMNVLQQFGAPQSKTRYATHK